MYGAGRDTHMIDRKTAKRGTRERAVPGSMTPRNDTKYINHCNSFMMKPWRQSIIEAK